MIKSQLAQSESVKRALLKQRSSEMNRFIATYLEGRSGAEESETERSDRNDPERTRSEEIAKLEMANRAAANSKLIGFFTLIP